ncbi:uncharacterized protein ARMOST_14693 [Armillaria ostoyae]|uniref:Ubiquitin-like protease family profile domain-containing protein n=1 Tax=Armillaria ostoyae TaxID=47428 RepID=A0A284RRB3_ARMOS|nr:uncharacterized protein ARMOST_14693 [Armillaria ostoyae]
MQLASPTRPGNLKNQNVSDSESSASLESSESPLSAPRDQATPRKGKRSKVLEMTTDQSGSPKKHVSKKWRLDTHPNIVHRLKTKHRLSMDSDGSTDPQASSNDGDSAFLDTLEGASQATYAYSELEDNEESSPHDSNLVDWSASLVLRSQSPTAEELSNLSNREQFDVLMAHHEEAMRRRKVNETPRTANVELAKDQGKAEHAHPVEGIPMSVVEFGDGELGEEYLHFMSEDVFSHGLTDEKGASASVDVPPTSKRPLDKCAEEGETTVKRQRVLSPSPASDIGALITATSRSFVGLSGATDSDKDEENPIYEINDKDKDDEPESPAEVSQWWDEFKKGLYDYLKDHQPVISLLNGEESPTLQCDLYQCVCLLLDASPDSTWRFYGRSIRLDTGSLQRLLKMGSSWLDDVMVNVALQVLCRKFSSWGMVESIVLASKNAAIKAFRRVMKAHIELSTSDFVLPIHEDKHWVLFHLNLTSHQILYYDSLRGDEDELRDIYERLWDFIKPVTPDLERPFQFQVAQSMPMQKDSINCEVYTIAFAWHLMWQGTPPSWMAAMWSTANFADCF